MSRFSSVLIWRTRLLFTLTKVGAGRAPPPKKPPPPPRPPSGSPPTWASVESNALAAATTAAGRADTVSAATTARSAATRSEEHTSELQSQSNLVCRLLLEKKKISVPNMNHDEMFSDTDHC